MKRRILLACVLTLSVIQILPAWSSPSDADNKVKDSYASLLPDNAIFADENSSYKVYLSQEEPPKDDFDLGTVSLWILNKADGKASKFMTTRRPTESYWYLPDGRKGLKMTADNITAVDNVIAVGDSTLIVSGVPDFRNIYSYIVDIPSHEAVMLPCNSGIVGFTAEEGLIIGLSYRYFPDPDIGGRYTYLQIFDWDGNQVAGLDLKDQLLSRPENLVGSYCDCSFKTPMKVVDYDFDCPYLFPVPDKNQANIRYDLKFDTLLPEDKDYIEKTLKDDPRWSKTEEGYRFLDLNTQDELYVDILINLKEGKITLIHGQNL